jgi:hypothetical protein
MPTKYEINGKVLRTGKLWRCSLDFLDFVDLKFGAFFVYLEGAKRRSAT